MSGNEWAGQDRDAIWQRPLVDEDDVKDQPEVVADPAIKYAGPPPMSQPLPGPVGVVVLPPAPPELPPQDHEAIDAAETQAWSVTSWVILSAGVLSVVLLGIGIIRAIVA